MGEAEGAYREYKSLADRMVALEPDNLRWRMEAAYADENLGIVLFYQRRFAEAARQLAGALRTIDGLAAAEQDNAQYQKEVSTVLAWLADAERARGNLDSAVALRTRQVELLRRLLAREPANVAYRQELIPAHQALGLLFASKAMGADAVGQFQLALAEADRLIPVEPENQRWKALAAQARIELARTLLAQGNEAAAAREARAGCAQAEPVLASDAAGSWGTLRTGCLAVRARLAMKTGDSAQALKLADQALFSARGERSADPANIRYSIATAQRLVGDIRQQSGDTGNAQAAWTLALQQLPQRSQRPMELQERAELLQRLGRAQEAQPILQRLAAIGYRAAS
jgi:tetratricopeptide (TPR) repeat protein